MSDALITLETERLWLRPMIISDLDDVFEYASNPRVGPNAGWKPHQSKEESLRIMAEIFLDRENIWGIVTKQKRKLIGSIGLIDDPKRQGLRVKMIGYSIGEPYWGRGFTTEASLAILRYGFAALELELISGYCYLANRRSRQVMEKCGFHYEGCLRKAEHLFDGIIRDHLCFSLLREEYEENYGGE